MSLSTKIVNQFPSEEVKSELDSILNGILMPAPRNKVAEFTADWKSFTSGLGKGILRKIS